MVAPIQSSIRSAPRGSGIAAALRLETSVPDRVWDEKASIHPAATIFHSSAWGKVLQHTYGHRLCYAELRLNGSTAAMVPLAEVRSWLTGTRGVSLPFTDACEPLVFDSQEGVLESLSRFGREQQWRHVEVRGERLPPVGAPSSTEFVVHELDLTPGVSAVEQSFDSATRRSLRKAETGGLKAEISSSLEAVAAYYQLHVATRRRLGAPPQPWRFFEHLHRFLVGNNHGFVVLARLGRLPVSGALFLHTHRHAVYKFGATELAFQDLRPSNLVMGTAIRHLAGKGIASLHFGRTSLTNDGLRRFKRGWGAKESMARYFRYDLQNRRWLTSPDRAEGAHTRFFRRLPVSVNRAFGALLYPHLD